MEQRTDKRLTDAEIEKFIEDNVKSLREKLTGKKVLCALSGGVDSAVTATLIHKAAPDSLICVFIDHGLMRLHEPEKIMKVYKEERKMNIIKVDAAKRFLSALRHVSEPERKRKIMGEEFIRVLEAEAKKLGAMDYMAQGTIYADLLESGSVKGGKHIKTHHNVAIPQNVEFKEIIEPLKTLYKDEVRRVGVALGLPNNMVYRQPFPGPGLGVRTLGEITGPKLDTLRAADSIFRDEIEAAKLDGEIWQYFAILTDARSTGIRDGARAYAYTVALRAVNTVDAITADFARIPYDVLASASARIVNEVPNVHRVVYDITTKPPATIEWE
ncbi:MAG: glutamine-hydrolyzing GMP synthase [Firmicutes bacterium]|nr:glutamine-hydrolyzing GMP synthase [Bacillota bacterium]